MSQCTGQTGVEMEALTACSVALLTICDRCKAVDLGLTVVRCEERPRHSSRQALLNSKTVAFQETPQLAILIQHYDPILSGDDRQREPL